MDLRIRRLERQASTGDVVVESQLLRQRLRAGTLRAERLRLAAYLGDGASRRLLQEAAPEIPGGYQAWLAPLRGFGPEVEVRASLAAARLVGSVYASFLGRGDPEHPQLVVDAAQRSVECPCVPHVQAVLDAARKCEVARARPGAVKLNREADAAVSACTSLVHLFGEPQPTWHVMHHARLAAFSLIESGSEANELGTLPGEAGRVVKDAVRLALVPWALGRASPARR